MTVFVFIVACLACYRLTVLFARDLGPFDIMLNLRTRFRVFACPYCISIWIALVLRSLFLLDGFHDQIVVMLAQVFAMSAVATILDRCFSSDYQPK